MSIRIGQITFYLLVIVSTAVVAAGEADLSKLEKRCEDAREKK